MIDAIDKKQICHSVITGRKQNASKEWNCIIAMVLMSFSLCLFCVWVSIFYYFICTCCKTTVWLFWLFLGQGRSGFFWWRQVGNPTGECAATSPWSLRSCVAIHFGGSAV